MEVPGNTFDSLLDIGHRPITEGHRLQPQALHGKLLLAHSDMKLASGQHQEPKLRSEISVLVTNLARYPDSRAAALSSLLGTLLPGPGTRIENTGHAPPRTPPVAAAPVLFILVPGPLEPWRPGSERCPSQPRPLAGVTHGPRGRAPGEGVMTSLRPGQDLGRLTSPVSLAMRSCHLSRRGAWST